MIRTISLLIFSNIFMTFAWYGHLKNNSIPLWKAIVVSWGIAFFEYCLMVPANRYGFVDGFSIHHNWYAKSHLAIDQGPIVVMIENYRTGLMWKLFMNIPDIQNGLKKLGFTSPYIKK